MTVTVIVTSDGYLAEVSATSVRIKKKIKISCSYDRSVGCEDCHSIHSTVSQKHEHYQLITAIVIIISITRPIKACYIYYKTESFSIAAML
jgi:hypothetical protein